MSRSVPAGALLFILCSAAAGQTSEEQLGQWFRAGQQALQQQEFALAVEDFRKVLTLDPTLVEAEVNLGLAYQSLLEYDLAVRTLGKALRDRPNLLGPTVIVGMDYLKLGSPEKAIPFLEQALKLDPSNLESRQALASSYLGQDNFGGAAEQFRQIALLDSDKSEAWFKLGHEYLDLAARLAYRGAHRYGNSAWGHRFLGDLLFQRGRWEDAINEYQKAVSAEPQQPGLHTSQAQAFLQADNLSEAEKEFRLELQLDPQSEAAWLGLANIQLARKQASAALQTLGQVWDISPEFIAVQREFPSFELPQETAKAYLSDLQDTPDTAAKHFLLTGLYTVASESERADSEWKSFQSYFSAWQQGGNAGAVTPADQEPCKAHRYQRCIDFLQARKHLTGAERLLIGKTHYLLQQYEAAAEALAGVQGVSTQNAEASYWLARTYQAQGAEAYAHLQESFPDSWRTDELRAEGYALRGNVDDALKQFHAALELRPKESELHEALGELYLDQHNDDEARNELERALLLDPMRTHALYLLGRLYVQKKENEQALPYLQRAVRLQPDLAEANSLLGTAYVRLGKFADAVPRLEKAAPSDHYGNVHYQLYLAYRKLGQTELAQKELARSHDLRQRFLERDQALIMGSPQPPSEP